MSNPAPQFTAHFTDLTKIEFIEPPPTGGSNFFKTRSYVNIARDESGDWYEVPVYVPVDSEMTHITFYADRVEDPGEYSVSFRVSCEVTYNFDHVARLAETIAPFAPTILSYTTRDAGVNTSVYLAAGTLIGYTGGTPQAHNWDFVFSNTAEFGKFINQERYENADIYGPLRRVLHADCPYDYYTGAMRREYDVLLSGIAPGETCLVTRDQPGTILGQWFKEPYVPGDPVEFDPGFGVVVRLGYTSGILIIPQIRIDVEDQPSVWIDELQPTYVDPSIAIEHCYEHEKWVDEAPPYHVYLKLLSDMEMAVAFGEGGCPQQLPAGYQVYYR